MIPFEILTELFEIATARYSRAPWSCATPPTMESVERIQRDLGIRVPNDFIRLATACPSYGSWLSSIGNDFDNGLHIVNLNKTFHESRLSEDEYAQLPGHLIMLNHGHDGDCDCWDTRVVTAGGEHPIIYVCVDAPTAEPTGPSFQSFREYAENFALHCARNTNNKAQQQRVKQLMQRLGGDIAKT